ncbi:MAG TPA: beta-ketoacyl synthase N-terminal-like domain-containing protein, partial [Dehalococcoidia bacterium]|nr:beta-ketoacyl synthase N-terminal-like domain-containing protein [Dehalococcoidia bacterium]
MATPVKKRQLGRPVSIVGAGMSRFGAFKGKSSRDLFVEAFQDLMEHLDQGIDVEDIECGYIGNYSSDLFEGQGHTAPIIADWLGMTPTPLTRIENACASSGSAFREGIMAIASGMYDIVLVGGVEKMTDLPTEGVTDVLASAADGLYEVPAGLTFPGIYGALAKAHMDRYETNLSHLLKVGIKNHNNGALNPKAQFNTSIRDLMERRKARAQERGEPVPDWQDEMDFLNDPQANPWVAWPLRLYDCAPITDGASCLLLVSSDLARNFTGKPVHIVGTGQATGRPLHDAEELTSLAAAKVASAQAYEMAGVRPE